MRMLALQHSCRTRFRELHCANNASFDKPYYVELEATERVFSVRSDRHPTPNFFIGKEEIDEYTSGMSHSDEIHR
jgi:hypothetical protein